MSRFIAVLTVVLLSASAHPAPAALPSPAPSPSLGAAGAAVDDAVALLRSGSLTAAVRAAAVLAEVPLPSSPPPSLDEPDAVAALLRAVEVAAVDARAALRDAPLVDGEMLADLMSRATLTPPDDAALERLVRMSADAAARVDEPLLYATTLRLAIAIERALPRLRLLDGATPRAAAAPGCDVIDLAPRLCVSGAGDSTNTADAALVIDLGGNDVHTHGAGAGSTSAPASVTIDLDGDDTYLRDRGPAQGAGNLGIGILVDAAGDDTYSTAVVDGNVATSSLGSNHSSGVGILADLEGSDVYAVSNTKIDQTTATGIGRGTQPGFGLLLDDGAGNDTYLLSARQRGLIETPTEVKVGGINVNGMGLGGLGGVGILSDGGGNDSMTMESLPATVPADETRPVTQAPVASASGFGGGTTGGAGLVRSGPGNTTRTTVASHQAPWAGIASGGAYGFSVQGVGALVDEGGDDSYVADLSSTGAHTARATESCDCKGAHAVAKQSIPNVGAAGFSGMGSATQGLGLLRDMGGDDRYEASVRAETRAIVVDERAAPGSSDAVATANASSLHAQGSTSGGIGVLEDLGGDDVYGATNLSRATATATAPGSSGAVELAARARAGSVYTTVQGAAAASGGVPGFAMLRDTAGSDRYSSSSESVATSDPPTEQATGTLFSSAQASVGENSAALLHDRDTGLADTFSLVPADPACSGTRGTQSWQDCGAGAGIGVVEDE